MHILFSISRLLSFWTLSKCYCVILLVQQRRQSIIIIIIIKSLNAAEFHLRSWKPCNGFAAVIHVGLLSLRLCGRHWSLAATLMNLAIVGVISGCQQSLSSRQDPGNVYPRIEKSVSRELTSLHLSRKFHLFQNADRDRRMWLWSRNCRLTSCRTWK